MKEKYFSKNKFGTINLRKFLNLFPFCEKFILTYINLSLTSLLNFVVLKSASKLSFFFSLITLETNVY